MTDNLKKDRVRCKRSTTFKCVQIDNYTHNNKIKNKNGISLAAKLFQQ